MGDNKVAMTLRFDLDKPREARFQQYLERNKADGVNKKEAILRLFERLEDHDVATVFIQETRESRVNNKESDGLNKLSMEELDYEPDPDGFDM